MDQFQNTEYASTRRAHKKKDSLFVSGNTINALFEKIARYKEERKEEKKKRERKKEGGK